MHQSRFRGFPVEVVKLHHEVLLPWCRSRRSHAPCQVLTLDHHTDVLDSGLTVPGFDFSDLAARRAIAALRHDQHLVFALKHGVIAKSIVISHYKFTPYDCAGLEVVCDQAWPPMQTMLNDPAAFRPFADRVLESKFLEKMLAQTSFDWSRPFILDVDLDYLLTRRALAPQDDRVLQSLLAKAQLITVSLESDWVRLLAIK